MFQFGFGVSKEAGRKKSVTYGDGLQPGRISPAHSGSSSGTPDMTPGQNQPSDGSAQGKSGKQNTGILLLILYYY